MGGVCRARNCFRSKDKCPDLPFFTFPKNPTSAKKWITNIGDPELLKRPASALKNNVVCALHFEEKYFVNKKKRTLVKNAVPTLFNIPPLRTQETQKKNKHSKALSERTDATFKGGTVFSCDVETIDNWHRQIDAVTEQLLSLLPESSSCTPQLDPQTEKKFVDVHTQYDENENDRSEFENRLNDLGKQTSIKCSESAPKVQLLCRLCSKLNHRERVMSIFSHEADKIQLVDMINSIMPSKVIQDDGLPQQICNLCVRKLTFCYDVRKEFLASEKKLRDLLGIPATTESVGVPAAKENVAEAHPPPQTPSAVAVAPPLEETTEVQPKENESLPVEAEVKESAITQYEDLKNIPKKRKMQTDVVQNKIKKKRDGRTLLLTGPHSKNTATDDSDFENDSTYEIHWYDEAYDDSISEDMIAGDSVLKDKKLSMNSTNKPLIIENAKSVMNPVTKDETKIAKENNLTTLNHKTVNETKFNISVANSQPSSRNADHSNVPVKPKITPGSVKVRLMTERQKLLKLKNKAQNKLLKQSGRRKSFAAKNSCLECKKSFTSKWKLDTHVLMHHKFECNECSRTFSNAEELSDHSKEHVTCKQKDVTDSGAMNHTCEVCKRVFKTRPRLLLHSKTHLTIPYTCTVCPKAFPTRIRLKQHLKSHKPEKSFRCSVCNESFKSNKTLFQHRTQHSKSLPSLKCETCSTVFTDLKVYEKHREIHTSSGFNSHVNDVTSTEIKSGVHHEEKQSDSVKNTDSRADVITVQDTDKTKTVKEDDDLIKVKVPHLEKNLIITSSDQFVCDICDCKFSSKRFQEEHKKVHHTVPTKGTLTTAPSSVESTVELPPTPERGKLYFCDQCGEGYERKRSLALHRFSHMSSHRCSHCHQSFSSEDSLTRHLENCVEVKEEASDKNHQL